MASLVLRFHFGQVERIPIRILEVRNEKLRIVDDLAAKHDTARRQIVMRPSCAIRFL
jgi:hypothetical protein